MQRICTERQIRLLYWSAMEAIVFGGRKVVVPAALEGMRDLTVTLGGVACEQRMIGWRIGWIVASEAVTPQLGMVHIYNGLVASGFNQLGAIAALRADDHAACVAEWERRHDATMEQLAGLPAIPAHGGWSLLFDAEAAGTTAPDPRGGRPSPRAMCASSTPMSPSRGSQRSASASAPRSANPARPGAGRGTAALRPSVPCDVTTALRGGCRIKGRSERDHCGYSDDNCAE